MAGSGCHATRPQHRHQLRSILPSFMKPFKSMVGLGLARTYRLGGKNPTYIFDSAEPDLDEHP
jgi:hypothetical protein